ncbi:MAG: hypothetical protein LBV60_22610 [Streptomyces sp.]|nr:hypothetical protein [Streptomyces sp.]
MTILAITACMAALNPRTDLLSARSAAAANRQEWFRARESNFLERVET